MPKVNSNLDWGIDINKDFDYDIQVEAIPEEKKTYEQSLYEVDGEEDYLTKILKFYQPNDSMSGFKNLESLDLDS